MKTTDGKTIIICAECKHYRIRLGDFDMPMCKEHTTSKIDPVSGDRIIDEVVYCQTQNINGACVWFEPRPRRKTHQPKLRRSDRFIIWAQAWAKAIWKAIK